MIGAPPTRHEEIEQIDTIVRCVDEMARTMDHKWGFGRLPFLVPIDLAEKFRVQRFKFSRAVLDRVADDVKRHGEAMLRAYAKLDATATETGHQALPPGQWEFITPDGLVVLVRDVRDVQRVCLDGRRAQVWSLDEISTFLRARDVVVAAKLHFDGAVVESIGTPADIRQELNDTLPW